MLAQGRDILRIARRFNAGNRSHRATSPEGSAEYPTRRLLLEGGFQSSLRDLLLCLRLPGIEMPYVFSAVGQFDRKRQRTAALQDAGAQIPGLDHAKRLGVRQSSAAFGYGMPGTALPRYTPNGRTPKPLMLKVCISFSACSQRLWC